LNFKYCSFCANKINSEDLYCRFCGHKQKEASPEENTAANSSAPALVKVKVPEGYPPEEGTYLRGNDYSPVAVAIILCTPPEEIAPSLEILVRTGIEAGAALSGTIQTENIGLEKMICNLVANPNIRYLIVGGVESPGHSTGNAILALKNHGVDDKRKIIGTLAPTPYLFNISLPAIERFREQLSIIDLINEGDPAIYKAAVRACLQEKPTDFRGQKLWDYGAFSKKPICEKISWKVRHPWYAPRNENEMQALERAQKLMESIKAKQGK
jgi:tetrahydromethanopterin S-methyltransferase subunit A